MKSSIQTCFEHNKNLLPDASIKSAFLPNALIHGVGYEIAPMLRHTDIWRAVDELAARYKLSPSGLAKKAGLDPTTFNKSKRQGPDGRLRWPSTESVSKILKATGASLDEFFAIIAGASAARPVQRVPVIGYAQAGQQGYFDDAG